MCLQCAYNQLIRPAIGEGISVSVYWKYAYDVLIPPLSISSTGKGKEGERKEETQKRKAKLVKSGEDMLQIYLVVDSFEINGKRK